MLQNHTMTEHTHIPRRACFASVTQLTEFVKLMFLSFAGSAGEAGVHFVPLCSTTLKTLLNTSLIFLARPCFAMLCSFQPSSICKIRQSLRSHRRKLSKSKIVWYHSYMAICAGNLPCVFTLTKTFVVQV